MEREFSSDSYVVDVLPPSDTFPAIIMSRRKKVRRWGAVAVEAELPGSPLGYADAFDDANIDAFALQVGKAILSDSEIIRQWRTQRGER